MKPTDRSRRLKAKLFRGFGDASRLSVLEALRDGPRCVSEVVAATRLSQPHASAHLACLGECGLVTRERRGKFVYYAKGPDVGGLWKVAVNGGEETTVLDLPSHLWGYWALVNDGIYFVEARASPLPALRFLSFGTGRVSHVVDLVGKPIAHWPGMAISPDGKWLLYTQVDHRSVDIMLVDNFR